VLNAIAFLAFFAAQAPQVSIAIEPPQTVNAFAITTGSGETQSVEVRDGNVLVTNDAPFPWTVTSAKFEHVTYTRDAFEHHQRLVLRELGTVRGTLVPAPKPADRNLSLLVKRSDADTVSELPFTASADGTFEARIPAGIYVAAIVGENVGSRLRSGIVVQPAAATDLGTIKCEPTITVTQRIVDGKSGKPVRHAALQWFPPEKAANADVAQTLYGQRWSVSTDARGIATFKSIGPLPLPVRWRINADGYAESQTMAIALNENRAVSLPDVKLRPEAIVMARVTLPRIAPDLKGASLVLSQQQDPQTLRFTAIAKQPLQEGSTSFIVSSYGLKRISVQTAAGRVASYIDFSVTSERTPVDVTLQTSEIHGVVARKNEPVDDATVTLADPHDPRVILAKATTGRDGNYRFTTYQSSGDLFLYTTQYRGQGSSTGTGTKTLHADGRASYVADFDLPNAGCNVKVVDAVTSAPLHARVDKRIDFSAGGGQMGMEETNADGRLQLSGYNEGSVTLNIAAKGHRAREMTIPLKADAEETLVRLEPTGEIEGRVVDENGAPISGARISGGFRDELTFQAYANAITNTDGRFHLDSAPPAGTTFYFAAPRYALGIATLQSDRLNVITLVRPTAGVVTLRPDHAPPTKIEVVMAAPSGGEYIPLGVLSELAEVNGMNPLQLHATARDGTVVLPEFLPPGSYDLFLFSKDRTHQRIGSVSLPLRQDGVVLAYKTK